MTAQTYHTPAPLNTYLRRATFGLSAERREEVWNEMEEHVLCRAEKLEFRGLSAEQALKQALREMGPPLRVCFQFNGVHNMPKLIAFGLVGILTVSVGMYALARNNAHEITVELPTLSQRPTKPICTNETISASSSVTIVSKKAGITCYTFANQGTFVGLNDVQKAYAAAGLKTQFNAYGSLRVTFPNEEWRVLSPQFSVNGQGYIPAHMLIVATVRHSMTTQLQLSGYNNPLLSFGSLKLKLGTKEQVLQGDAFYRSLLGTFIGLLTTKNLEQGWKSSWQDTYSIDHSVVDTPSITVQTGLKTGEVVMLVTQAKHQPPKGELSCFADIAPVNADGTVKLFTEGQTLTFVKDIKKLTASNGQNLAVLVKVTGVNLRDLKSGIFLPQP